MRYIRIFLLHFEHVLEYRSRIFVWFLFPALSTFMYLLFWHARSNTGNPLPSNWTIQDISNYYILLMLASSVLTSHIENDIAIYDIYKGEIIKYITKPIGYFLAKLYVEIPYRLIQGVFAFIIITVVYITIPDLIKLKFSLSIIFFGTISSFLAFILSQTYKSVIGLSAFWLTDSAYFINFVDILYILLAGSTLPLIFLNEPIRSISLILPFGSMLYTPVIIIMGKVTLEETIHMMVIQILWLIFFSLLYKILFKKGVKNYMGAMD